MGQDFCHQYSEIVIFIPPNKCDTKECKYSPIRGTHKNVLTLMR